MFELTSSQHANSELWQSLNSRLRRHEYQWAFQTSIHADISPSVRRRQARGHSWPQREPTTKTIRQATRYPSAPKRRRLAIVHPSADFKQQLNMGALWGVQKRPYYWSIGGPGPAAGKRSTLRWCTGREAPSPCPLLIRDRRMWSYTYTRRTVKTHALRQRPHQT